MKLGKFSILEEDQGRWSDSLKEVEALLELHKVLKGKEDEMPWLKEESDIFSLRSCYSTIVEVSSIISVLEKSRNVLWTTQVPMKIKVFGWRTFLNRLATRDHLISRGITSYIHDLSCVFCFLSYENLHHIFFECGVTLRVWSAINMWIRLTVMEGEDVLICFLSSCNNSGMKVKKNKEGIIWWVVLWSLWK